MHSYKHHIGDYDSHTTHLTWDEDMAYTRLLRLYYSREAPIPLDPGIVFRLVRAQCRTAKEAVTRVLHEFFKETPEGWRNKRADEEIAKYKSLCEFNQLVGRLGGRPSKTRPVSRKNPTGFGNKPNHKPITNNQEPITSSRDAQRSRGSRLPQEWNPPEPLEAWAIKERPDLDLKATIASFRDYWVSVPGTRGTKLDWDATFRNWVRSQRAGKPTTPDYSAVIANLKDGV